jgi:multidrug resistance efflux pump
VQTLKLDFLRAPLAGPCSEETLARLRDAARIIAAAHPGLQTQVVANRQQRGHCGAAPRRRPVGGQLSRLKQRKELTAALAGPLRPIDGVVVTFDRVLGQAVKPDDKLFGIHDLSQPLVQGYVSERDVASIRTGQDVRVRLADPATWLTARWSGLAASSATTAR